MLQQKQNNFWFKANKVSSIFYISLAASFLGIIIKNLALATCPLIFSLFFLYSQRETRTIIPQPVAEPIVTLPTKPDRVGVFIDGQYLYHAAKSDSMTVSYPKLKRVLQYGAAPESEIFFFTNLEKSNPNYEKFLETLQSMGYQVVRNGDFASLITEKVDRLDTAIIVSGNRERNLVKTIQSLTERDINLKLVAFPSSTDPLLWELATEYINILALPQVCQPS